MDDKCVDYFVDYVSEELPYDKKYNLPEISYVKYNNITLAIAADYGTWIILDNECQHNILERIKSKYSIGAIIESNHYSIDDIITVLKQIEGKKFDKPRKSKSLVKDNLTIHLTNECNLKCPHCYMKSGNKVRSELSTPEIVDLCKNYYDFGGNSITLTGGEPTLRQDLFEILDFLNLLNIDIYLLSNGSLWNVDKINEFSKRKIKEVQFSIDGFNEETNAFFRGSGVFTKCMNTIDLLCNLGKCVSVAITPPFNILKTNQEKYIDFATELLELYHDNIKIFFTENLMIGRYLNEDKLKQFQDEYKELVEGIVAKINPHYEEDLFISRVKNTLNDVCGYGKLVVLSNGDYCFCDDIPRSKVAGNIRNTSFKQIINQMIEAEKSCNVDNFTSCKSCELRYICGGGCKIKNFPSNDINNPFDYDKCRFCSAEKKQKYYKLMISTNEDFYCK